MRAIRRYRAVFASAVVVAVVAGGALTATMAGAKTTPHLVVTPVSGLKNGSKVRVSGTGFTPHDTVYVVECLARATGSTGCNITGAVPVTITAKGVLHMTGKFTVTTGTVGNGTCGTKKSNLKSCAISAGNATGGDSAVARIQFVLPKG
jgi:Neocarzinostatin family